MRDTTRFEGRLRTALLDHTHGGPTGFDAVAFAHEVATGAPRRRGVRAAVAWRPTPAAGLPWVAVLTLLLLAVTAGALFIVGSPAIRLPGVVPPEGATACAAGSNPDLPGPADQPRPPFAELFSPVAVDTAAGRMVAVVDPVGDEGVQTWTFDLCTNTWSRAPGSATPGRGPASIGALAYDARSGLVVGIEADTGSAWTYDVARDLWSRGAELGGALAGVHLRLVDEPDTDRVIAVWDTSAERYDVFAYDLGDDAWTPVGSTGRPSSGPVAFDPEVGRLLIADYLDGALVDPVRLMDPATGSVTESSAASPRFNYGWEPPNVADTIYDPLGRRMVVFNMGRMLAYSASRDQWTTLYDAGRENRIGEGLTGSRMRWRASIAWDPINERMVVYGGSYNESGTWLETDRVEAFDPATATWSTLLETSGDRPSP